MDDFFSKIKKKLSVDNIIDLMKDGKLKEEIKQTLTAGVNLNEKPKPDDFRPCIEVPSIENSTQEGQTKVHTNENSEKQDVRPSIAVNSILESGIKVSKEKIFNEPAEQRYKETENSPEGQLRVAVTNLNEPPKGITEEGTSRMALTKKRSTFNLKRHITRNEEKDLTQENTTKQGAMKFNDVETDPVVVEIPVVHKTPPISHDKEDNADNIDFEMFLG